MFRQYSLAKAEQKVEEAKKNDNKDQAAKPSEVTDDTQLSNEMSPDELMKFISEYINAIKQYTTYESDEVQNRLRLLNSCYHTYGSKMRKFPSYVCDCGFAGKLQYAYLMLNT